MAIGKFNKRGRLFGLISDLENPGPQLTDALRAAGVAEVHVPRELIRADLAPGTRVQFEWHSTPNGGVSATAVTYPVAPPAPPVEPLNPYNFVSLLQPGPLERGSGGGAPTHDRFHTHLLSGVLKATLTAVTPILVPGAERPGQPWECLRPGGPNAIYGLPGSSVKGVLRAMYEAWTNGHLGRVRKSLEAKVAPFCDNDRDELRIEDADSAQASFGFAAPHKEAQQADKPQTLSHPFKGRIQPTTFWAEGRVEPGGETRLKPLMSPAAEPPRFYERAGIARGRKLYWHQRWPAGEGLAPTAHASPGGDPWRPLPAGTVFSGEIHFTNLEPYELGALIVSIAPGYFWGTGIAVRRAYGIKLGKAKPRGWGSLAWERLTVTRRNLKDAYRGLDGSSLEAKHDEDATVAQYVSDFKAWMRIQTKAENVENLDFVRDLARLLTLPSGTWVISYAPQGTRDDMPLARDVDVPCG